MKDRLDVRAAPEARPLGLEFPAQREEVVDLTVAHHGDLAVRRLDRLLPTGEIDDRQAPETKRERPAQQVPFVVRPAMLDGVGHGTQPRELALDGAGARHESCETAHGVNRGAGGACLPCRREIPPPAP